MKASVVDLRHCMRDILKALERNEEVSVLYHGKVKGTILPAGGPTAGKVREHPFFNMCPGSDSVSARMEELRGGRYGAV